MASKKKSSATTSDAAKVGGMLGLVSNLTDPKKTKRLISVGKVVAPLVAPLAVEGIAKARGALDTRRAKKLGVPVENIGAYRGPTGRTMARIDALSDAIHELRRRRTGDALIVGFADASEDHLINLATATHAAAPMPASRRRATIAAISRELDHTEAELMTFLVSR